MDLVAGAPNGTSGGAYYVYSGASLASGTPVVPIGPPVQPPATPQRLGCAATGVGDDDGDGVPDFAVGAEGSPTGTPGRVYVISGASYATLATILAPSASPTFGVALSECGNLTTSGKPTFLIADPGHGAVYPY